MSKKDKWQIYEVKNKELKDKVVYIGKEKMKPRKHYWEVSINYDAADTTEITENDEKLNVKAAEFSGKMESSGCYIGEELKGKLGRDVQFGFSTEMDANAFLSWADENGWNTAEIQVK